MLNCGILPCCCGPELSEARYAIVQIKTADTVLDSSPLPPPTYTLRTTSPSEHRMSESTVRGDELSSMGRGSVAVQRPHDCNLVVEEAQTHIEARPLSICARDFCSVGGSGRRGGWHSSWGEQLFHGHLAAVPACEIDFAESADTDLRGSKDEFATTHCLLHFYMSNYGTCRLRDRLV